MKGYLRLYDSQGRGIGATDGWQPTPEAYDYLVYREGDMTNARNGRTGEVEMSSISADDVFNYALTHGKHVIAVGKFDISSVTVPAGVVLDVSAADIDVSKITVDGTLKDGSTWYSDLILQAATPATASVLSIAPPELRFIGQYWDSAAGESALANPVSLKIQVASDGTSFLGFLFNGVRKAFMTPGTFYLGLSLIPQADATFVVGTSTNRFLEGHFSGLVYTGGVATATYVDDYGGGFANFTPPTGEEGLVILAQDTNATTPGTRLYAYINGAWHYVDLT